MQPFIETVVNRRMHRQAGRGCSTVNFGLGAQPPYRCNNTAAAAQLQQHHQLKLSAGPSWLGLSLAWAAAAWAGHPVIERSVTRRSRTSPMILGSSWSSCHASYAEFCPLVLHLNIRAVGHNTSWTSWTVIVYVMDTHNVHHGHT